MAVSSLWLTTRDILVLTFTDSCVLIVLVSNPSVA
jgi:hypothetical protein